MGWQTALRLLTDVVFFTVLVLAVLYLLSDGAGILVLSRYIGGMVLDLFAIGAPLSLILSLISKVSLKGKRYKLYSWISGFEVTVLLLLYLIIYQSQI